MHFCIMFYMFIGLAIVCDDYFCASLELICEKLHLSDDVAGATFMAAGGSAPEFFTSLLGVFFLDSNVGFGTIVGSATFNVLFVIGLCAYFSGFKALALTWFPLARDCMFYLICLSVLAVCIVDKEVHWYEAMVLCLLYLGYVMLMYFDPLIRNWAIGNVSRLSRRQGSQNQISPSSPQTETKAVGPDAVGTEPTKNSTSTVHEERREEEAEEKDAGIDDDCWPEWPSEGPVRLKLVFIINAPLNFAMSATIPNCGMEAKKKYFMATFCLSVAWISLLTYVMIIMADDIGRTLGMSTELMAVTILAMGTSVPDAVSSLLVARDGHGDMALSSSIGSNVFDVTCGLPIPWLIKTTMVKPGYPIIIEAQGMEMQVGTLMGMVVIVILSVHWFGWKISKPLGMFYFVLYALFLVEAVLLSECVIKVSGC